jgi:hypothetical protein
MNELVQRRFDYDVFLSYSSHDKDRVVRLAERLDKSGLRVWFDDWAIKSGAEISLAVQDGLISSRHIIACWSPKYCESKWGKAEILTTLFPDPNNEDRRFIPVLLADCDLPDAFRRFKFVDYRTESKAAFLEILSASSTLTPETDFIQPLHVAEDRFLQLLLFQFSLRRWHGQKGVELRLHFNDETPAIWNSQGKGYLLGKLDRAKRRHYQKKLDEFLLRGKRNTFEFNDAKFLFRYASAGTLPVIRFGDEDERYYCLFYRDVYPIGWNIANGGCDNRAELLDPEITLARELREELVVADFPNCTRYVFAGDSEALTDHPAHAVARELWRKAHPDLNLNTLKTEEVAIEWQQGPDSLHIQVGHDELPPRRGFFLNINGEDFGIEVDRIAEIRLPKSAILFDGELDGGWLVNSPVGLFKVADLHRRLRRKESAFRPDFFFFDAKRYKGQKIDGVLQEFAQHVRKFRSPKETRSFIPPSNQAGSMASAPSQHGSSSGVYKLWREGRDQEIGKARSVTSPPSKIRTVSS